MTLIASAPNWIDRIDALTISCFYATSDSSNHILCVLQKIIFILQITFFLENPLNATDGTLMEGNVYLLKILYRFRIYGIRFLA